MAIGELLSAIEREAATEARALRDAANAEAASLLAEATRARERDLDAQVDAHRSERARAAEREIAAVERHWRGEVLAARAEALDRLYAATRAAVPGELDARIATALLDAAIAALGDGAGTVHCTPSIATTVRAHVAGRPALRVVDDLAANGVVIERDDGLVRVDATLEAHLAAAWPELRQRALPEDAP